MLEADKIGIATHLLYEGFTPRVKERKIDDTDGIRGDLAICSIAKAVGLGVRVAAADGGSPPAFLAALEQYLDKGLTLIKSKIPGRGPQRRDSFRAASLLPDVSTIVYMQPEKVSLLDYLDLITAPILDGSADLVIPSRDPELLRQFYPDYMWQSEIQVNATYNRFLRRENILEKGVNLDWFFGPVVFKNDPKVVELFMKRYRVDGKIKSKIGAEVNPEKNSDGHYFPVIEALFKGMKVVSVEIPFVYPPTQRENEMSPEKIKGFIDRRIMDGAAYRLELIHFVEFLKERPSKIRS